MNIFNLNMLFLILGFMSTSLIKFFWRKRFIPHTVIYLILGLICGLVNKYFNLGDLSNDIDFWANINSHDLLLYFVPPLIFHSAFSIKYNDFLRYKYHIAILTVFPLLLSIFLLGSIIFGLVSFIDNNYIKSLIIGVILSATDPVTIVTILEKLNISSFLHILLECESLLNDGLSILVFNILASMINNADTNNYVFLGFSPILSILFAYFSYYIFSFFIKRIQNDSLLESSLFLTMPFFIFYISELLHLSGVFVLVIFGLNMARYGNLNISINTINVLEHFLSVTRYLFNTILFFLLGVIVTSRINFYKLNYSDYLFALLSYVLSNLVRFLAISIFYPLFRKLNKNISFKDIGILSLSGMKGEITVVLSLSTQSLLEDDYNKILLMLLTNVVLSIIFNSIFLEIYLQKFYKKKERVTANQQLIKRTISKVTEKSKLYFDKLKDEERFLNNANWNLISEKIGISDETTQENQLINMNQLFINIMQKKNKFLYIKGIINNKTYSSIEKILDFDNDNVHFHEKIMSKIDAKIDEKVYFNCYKKTLRIDQYLLIISFLLLIDLSYKKLHNFVNNQILELNITYKYNTLKNKLINILIFFEENYKDLTAEIENNHAIKMIIINQISNLKEIYKDGEINKSIYQEILSKIMYKYKNIT